MWLKAVGTRKAALGALTALGLLALAGCPAVYPELATLTKAPRPGVTVTPPPPANLYWIHFTSARIPPITRGGRPWRTAPGSRPDPYAKLLVNGKELLRTPVQSGTLEPTWPSAPRGNFRIERDDRLRVEVWDDNVLSDGPIGVRDVGPITEELRASRQLRVNLEGGAEVELAVEPAHAVLGLGFWYELRTDSVVITRLLAESPASRTGVEKGDRVMRLGGRDVTALGSDEVQSLFNAVPMDGLAMLLRTPGGATKNVTLREGPIYPLFVDLPVE
jgi:hypothetical protein